jgi:Ala-tRNA(Pro) deacylase
VKNLGEKEKVALINYLNLHGITYRHSSHESVFTSAQAAEVRNTTLRSGAKALLFGGEKGDFVLAVIRADRRVHKGKLAVAIGSLAIRLAKTKELRKVTGCEPGSLHPFGNMWGIPVVLDKNFDVDEINFNAGTNTDSVHLRLDDFIRFVKPKIIDIAEEDPGKERANTNYA